MKLLDRIKEFFDEPDQMDAIEERFYKRLEDMKTNPEKYSSFSKTDTNSSKIPPVSLF